MKNTFRMLMASMLVFVSLVTILPSESLAECDHFTYCCEYYTGSLNCDACGESYSPVRIIHHMLEADDGSPVDCCSYILGDASSSNNSNNSSNKGNNNGGNSYYGGYQYTAPAASFDTVEFGSFEQDNNTSNGEEPIEWYVLYSDGDKALLLSRYALINKQFYSSWTNVTWDNSIIRNWLNNDFYYSAFTNNEKNSILTNGKGYSSWQGEYGEITTSDNVFLLSLDEVNYYIVNVADRLVAPTSYAKSRGIQVENGLCWWWLRTNGDNNKFAQFIFEDGSISTKGRDVSSYVGGVRPAIWVDASAIGLSDGAADKKDIAQESLEEVLASLNILLDYLGNWKLVYVSFEDEEGPAKTFGLGNLFMNLEQVDNEYIDMSVDGETVRLEWDAVFGELVVHAEGERMNMRIDEHGHLFLYDNIQYLEFERADKYISSYLGNWKPVSFSVDGVKLTIEELGEYDLDFNLKAVDNCFIEGSIDGTTSRERWKIVEGGMVIGEEDNSMLLKIDEHNHLFLHFETNYVEFVREYDEISRYLGSWKIIYMLSGDEQGTPENLGTKHTIVNLKGVDDEYIEMSFGGVEGSMKLKWQFIDGMLVVQSGDAGLVIEIDEDDHLFLYDHSGYMELVREND